MKAIRDPNKVGVPPQVNHTADGDGREGVEIHGGSEQPLAMRDIVHAEEELILEMFHKLKDKRDGELRVSTRRNPRSGVVEIIYIGAHEKGDLSKVRRLYEQASRGMVTF